MKSIKTKIMVYVGLLLLFVCIVFGLVSYKISESSFTEEISGQLPDMAVLGSDALEESLAKQWNTLAALAENDKIQGYNASWDEASKILQEEITRSGVSDMAIADMDGNTKSPIAASINVKDREYFTKALNGENAVSDPIVSIQDGSVIITFAVPIKNNGNVIGALLSIQDGNALSDITSKITFGETGAAFMINDEGTCVANADPEKVLSMDNIFNNYKSDPALKPLADIEQKMVNGESGYGEYTYKGVTKACGYSPVEGTNWSLAITAPKSEVMEGLTTLKLVLSILTIIILVISTIALFIFTGLFTKPIIAISNHLKVMADGDLTRKIPGNIIKMKDEIGTVGKSLDALQLTLNEIIWGIKEQSKTVSAMTAAEKESIFKLTNQIEDVSATTEELAAGIEETAASTEEITATSDEIGNATDAIARKAAEGAITADEIHKRANSLKEHAKQAQKSANEIYRETEISLKDAIEQSQAVEQINALSESILQITAQTNLLALNAAIEAARAGEAGKGFAVVADEIRVLATNSKDTVTKIQDINQVVLESVGNLTKHSSQLLEFINSQVLKDYDTLVKTGEQYNEDANVVNEIVTDLSATSEELSSSIQNIMKAIQGIATASNEGAQGTTQIAERVSNITLEVKEVLENIQNTKEIAEVLMESVSVLQTIEKAENMER